MENSITNQLYVFIIFIISGFIIGLFFDSFRILRKIIKTSDIITTIQDIIFWIMTGFFLLFVIFYFNEGEIRGYIFLGLTLGITIYILLFSRYFLKINIVVLCRIKKFFVDKKKLLHNLPFICKKKKDFRK